MECLRRYYFFEQAGGLCYVRCACRRGGFCGILLACKEDGCFMVSSVNLVEKAKKPRTEEKRYMVLADYIRSQCKDRKSTLAYFKRAGLTWDKQGNPIVVPR